MGLESDSLDTLYAHMPGSVAEGREWGVAYSRLLLFLLLGLDHAAHGGRARLSGPSEFLRCLDTEENDFMAVYIREPVTV